MNWFQELLSNGFLLVALSAWFWAQLIKTVIHAIVTKKIDFTRLVGDGGMPSGHSATVSSLATAAAIVYGPGSLQFAIAFIFAIVVCKDAMGVRLETGKQAAIINDIVESFNALMSEKLMDAKLKEFVGHTPLQVIAGILLGVVNALILFNCDTIKKLRQVVLTEFFLSVCLFVPERQRAGRERFPNVDDALIR